MVPNKIDIQYDSHPQYDMSAYLRYSLLTPPIKDFNI